MKTCGVKNFFSLIELLLVVGIMALLMGISLPAFSKMVRGSGTKLTTRNIVAKVNAARSYAITTRSNVAILFPSDGVSNANFYYTHYRVCKVYKDGSNWKWLSWIEGEDWTKIQTGTLIQYIASSEAGTDQSGATEVKNINLTDTPGESSTSANIARALVFTSTGLLANSNAPYFKISEGMYQGGAFTAMNASNTLIFSINPFTGRISYSNN